MKKSVLPALCALCVFTLASVANAQLGSAENALKTQAVNEADVFYNADDSANVKAAAFSPDEADGTVKCWRRYYRPRYVTTTYYWRPAYYPVYYYTPIIVIPTYTVRVVPTTIVIFKGGESTGAMIDSNPIKGSALDNQGVRKGDIITAIDGKPLQNFEDVKNVTADSKLTIQKGNQVKFAGNLLSQTDKIEGNVAEAGTLLTKAQIQSDKPDMYGTYDAKSGPTLGVKAADNGGNGVKITEVLAGQAGQKAGFEVGDVILEINGKKINGEQDYSDAIDLAGTVARMKIFCGKTNKEVDADVKLNK